MPTDTRQTAPETGEAGEEQDALATLELCHRFRRSSHAAYLLTVPSTPGLCSERTGVRPRPK